MKNEHMEQMHNPHVPPAATFFSLIRNPLKFKMFLLKKLPAALFSGVRLDYASEEECVVSVPYKWQTKNPFRSTYFACLSMAAEMSTGILAMSGIYGRQSKISTLVVGVEGKFYKKASSRIRFICESGALIRQTVEMAIATSNAQEIRVLSSGFNEQGELVAEFWITWSFKTRK